MGITYIDGFVGFKGKERSVKFLVDSGAIYNLVVKDIWESLELVPNRTIEFTLADGSVIKRNVSECVVKLPISGAEGHAPVILGEPGDDENLLGIVTLEIFGLMLDPLKREIRPMRMILR